MTHRAAETAGSAVEPGGRTLRILLVTYSFPPMNSIGSHRPYGWARAWRDLGHEVHVLTPAKHSFDGPMDLDLDCTGIGVHEVDYLPGRAAGLRPSGDRAQVQRWERFKTATRPTRFSLAMFGDPRLLAYFAMVRRGREIIRDRGIEMIVATTPPEISFFVARTLARRAGIPWVADFRDLWFHDTRLQHTRMASSLSGIVHRWLVRNAAALVTVSERLRQRLAGDLGREVLLSYNGYFASLRAQPAPPRPWADDAIHMVYAGRVYPGRQDPEPLFRALDALRRDPGAARWSLVVDFYGHENPWLRELVARYRLEDRVRLHGFVPYRESLAVQRAADALLFLDWTDVAADGVLTGKLFEYLGSARPILSLGRRKDTEAAALISDTQCGVTLTGQEEIEAWLRDLAARAPLHDVGAPARERLSRETQARILIEALTARLF